VTSGRAEPAVEVRRATQRFVTETDRITSRHAFSFGQHYDPHNVGFGRLLAVNDDLVRSGGGYDPHPHRDAEIITWVLSGSLVHSDSFGNSGIVHRGLAQRMSAGSGIVHSERNDAFRLEADRPPEPVHFIQMWVRPDHAGGTPGYAQRELPMTDLDRRWLPVASGDAVPAGVDLDARGCTLWVTDLAPGVRRLLPEGDQAYVLVVHGTLEAEAAGRLGAGDSLRITGRVALALTGVEPAEVLLWTMSR
jgi:redox-sensitive bicupin YhaK (pirin superfamily)